MWFKAGHGKWRACQKSESTINHSEVCTKILELLRGELCDHSEDYILSVRCLFARVLCLSFELILVAGVKITTSLKKIDDVIVAEASRSFT